MPVFDTSGAGNLGVLNTRVFELEHYERGGGMGGQAINPAAVSGPGGSFMVGRGGVALAGQPPIQNGGPGSGNLVSPDVQAQINVALTNAQRFAISFNNNDVAVPGNFFRADYQTPGGKVAIIDQFEFFISPTPPLSAPSNTISCSLLINNSPQPNYQNIVGYTTDRFDSHLVVDENFVGSVLVNFAFAGTSFALVRIYGRLLLKNLLPPGAVQLL